MIPRRIIPRDELRGTTIERPRSTDPQLTCEHAIGLDGKRYTCGREVRHNDRIHDGIHDGIHDAFAEHVDQGSVRW